MDKFLLKILQRKTSWRGISRELRKINGKCPVAAGKLFEYFCKAYFRYFYEKEFDSVWLSKDIPGHLREDLGLPRVEHGVDLLIRSREGKYLAVQCKFRNDENAKISWSKDDLSNLFAEGNECGHFIIFTNAAGVDEHSLTKYRDRLTVITCDVLQEHLNGETIWRIVQLLRTSLIVRAKRFRPLPHQNKAIAEVVSGFKKNNRGKLILPCGAGKTLAALWIKERLNVRRTLVLVPSLALLRQFHESWKAQQRGASDYLCVCSEKDIDKAADSNVSHLYEIQAPGRVTTDPIVICNFLRRSGPRIIYSTYQSSPQIARALKSHKLAFDLAICDEAHKTAGERKHSAFATVLDDRKIPCKKRLFMTATPRVVSSIVKNKLGDQTYKYLADMNDAATYGPELYKMTFAEAIKEKILVDYKMIAIGITDEELRKHIQERKFVKGTTIDEIASNYALAKVMRNYKCRHAVTFHSSVKKAQQFRERHEALYRDTESLHINGAKTTKERKQILHDFKHAAKAIVTNARCLTEGVDVPAIDAVYFCDPKYSKIDIVQAAGRALRQDKARDKRFGHIVIPVYHSKADDLEEHVSTGVFSQLVRVVRAMADQDERIEEEISEIAYGEGARKPSQRRIRIDVDKVKLIEISGFEKKLEKSLFFDVIRKTIIPWRPFEEARAFVHKLRLKSRAGWEAYYQGKLKDKPPKPDDISSFPKSAYRGGGWSGWGDWLGTGTIATRLKEYRLFKEARTFVRELKLKSGTEWRAYCRGELKDKLGRPDDVPTNPNRVYRIKGWKGMGDWLGTRAIAPRLREYRPFKKARFFVHKLKLKSQLEWRAYCRSEIKGKSKKPEDMPVKPDRVYKPHGWNSWGDWLGTGTVSLSLREYRPYKEARTFAHQLKLKSAKEWRAYCRGEINGKLKKPDDIPACPNQAYDFQGWSDWGDWLGTKAMATNLREYQSFKNARAFVRRLKLNSTTEWKAYCRGKLKGKLQKPDDISTHPYRTYKDEGWKGMGDWLGTGRIADQYKKHLPFKKARVFVRKLKLKSQTEWFAYCRDKSKSKLQKPEDIPANSAKTYRRHGWNGWGDWLGTGTIAPRLREYRAFEQARIFARRLKLKSGREWKMYCHGKFKKRPKKPDDMPFKPDHVYAKKGWKGMGDWLGK